LTIDHTQQTVERGLENVSNDIYQRFQTALSNRAKTNKKN